MRVLLPVHHNSNEDYDYEDEEEEELLATEAPPDHARAPDPPPPQILHCRTALAFQGADSTPLPPVEKFGAPVTDDQKKRPAVVASRKRAYSPFQVPSPNEEGPKKVCVKPPPPSYKSTNMTAPRYPEEEARTLPHDHGGEVLENEPPPVAASAGGNHAVRNGAAARTNDPTEDDEAYATTPVPVAQDVFAQALKAGGLEIVDQEGDGNCLFRAVSLQVYGDSNMHQEVRTRCLDFMAVNEEHFGQFVTGEAFGDYLARKRLDGVHGNNPEIQAISELFNRPVEVFTPDTGGLPLNIFHAEYSTSDIPIRLSYHDGNHYNAVIDPIKPTAGLGLGLPGLQPGLADKQQMATAVAASDQQMDLEKAIQESQQDMSQDYDDDLQRALKESSESVAYMYKQKALALSDLDATSDEMEQNALESSLQTYMQSELSRKKRASPGSHTSRARQRSKSPELPLNAPVLPAYAPAPTAAAAAPVPAAAAAAASPANHTTGPVLDDPYEYPAVVQELAMNGFELPKVVRAYELIGDNFDDLLSFLCSNTG